MRPMVLLLVALALAGCSRSESAPSNSTAAASASVQPSQQASGTQARTVMAATHDFHRVLKPLWHDAVPKGETDRVCMAVPELRQAAQQLQTSEMPPELVAKKEAFQQASAKLQSEIDSFAKACDSRGSDFDLRGKFAPVHEAYHAVVELVHEH